MSRHRHMQMLTVEQLNKLTTKRLLGVLKVARAVEQSEYNRLLSYGWCCNICKEWLRGKEAYQNEVVKPIAHLTAYKNRIKKILATRENVE